MSFSTTAKNTMLDGLSPNQVQLHNGDPGSTGTNNRVGGVNGEEAATYGVASNGSRNLTADVPFTGLAANQGVTWISIWDTVGPTFLAKAQLSGDAQANADGEFDVVTSNADLTVIDPP